MPQNIRLEPTIIVILGAGGDLAWRKLVPALYDLLLDQRLPEQCAIVGVARKPLDDETFRRRIREGVDQFSRRGIAEEAVWRRFADSISYVSEDLGDPASGTALSLRLGEIEVQWGGRANRVYYLAVPPAMMEPAAAMLQRLGEILVPGLEHAPVVGVFARLERVLAEQDPVLVLDEEVVCRPRLPTQVVENRAHFGHHVRGAARRFSVRAPTRRAAP